MIIKGRKKPGPKGRGSGAGASQPQAIRDLSQSLTGTAPHGTMPPTDSHHQARSGWHIDADETLSDLYDGDLTIEDLALPDDPAHRSDRRQSLEPDDDIALISKARQEALAIREQAQHEGFEEGLAMAQPVLDECRQHIETFFSARQTALEKASHDLAPIILEVVGQVLQMEARCDEELVVHMVKRTIQQLDKNQKRLTVKVNPQDLETLENEFNQRPPLKGSVEWYVEADATVDPGSCMVETESGLVDARFSTQIETLGKLLLTARDDD